VREGKIQEETRISGEGIEGKQKNRKKRGKNNLLGEK